ncbi:endonuclease MutS2 [uncultured Selenomonas sp.]|uniref:endonuclease MutS2 n=1 Tax=uncultured Selenomonas sp. TaxID=159275 RepID=UPI0025FD4D6D|nr:endonuclease MutS2 [uncultured Selenomonas sp.]
MQPSSYKILEYDRIRALLADCASSSLGKERARSIEPSSDREDVVARLAETAEAVRIAGFSASPLGGIRDLRPMLKKVKLGAALTLDELMDVRSFLYATRNVKEFFKTLETDAPMLKDAAHTLELLGQLERNLDLAMDEHGELRDDASVELRRIRRERAAAEAHIKERINAILHAPEHQKHFQDALVTIRDERYVLPVKAEYRRFFPGIVHDQSATGATLFIEPMAIVEAGNDIKQLTIAEQREITRILKSLSHQVQQQEDALTANADILAQIDFAFAKARLAFRMKATEPQLSAGRETHLLSARHPLIPGEKVVPIDIELGTRFSMLLITGPNTGGKTVSMKTLGLLVLMAQSGCFLPVQQGSTIALYNDVFADIGDEQSIEQSLSTFSAHMTHIVSILDQAGADDLVLVDELGAGTDPEEGAALAMAILERLLTLGAATVATTHYSELKTFAYTKAGIENACVEFDVKTLRPTYRLLIGIPGASNAFAISGRLGLADSIILRAKELIRADHAQFEHVVDELEQQKMMYEQMNADIAERQQRVQKLEAKVAAQQTAFDQKKGDLIKKARQESAALVRRTRREAEDIIDQLKKQFDDQGIHARQEAMQEARRRLNEASAKARPGIVGQKHLGKKIDLKTLQPGDTVYLTKLDQKGTVLAIQGKELELQVGSLRTSVRAKDCRFLGHGGEGGGETLMNGAKAPLAKDGGKHAWASSGNGGTGVYRQSRGTTDLLGKTATARREIDIRGLMVDEAESTLGKFIDDAQIAGLGEILIIHGKGTGALRKGVQAYLKHHASVLSYQFADQTDGGTGATVVQLK